MPIDIDPSDFGEDIHSSTLNFENADRAKKQGICTERAQEDCLSEQF